MRKVSWLTIWVCSLLVTVPVLGSEISSFIVPYGYRAPLLKRGDFALNLFHYYETKDSTRDYFDATSEYRCERTRKTRYLSLNGVYALIDRLIIQSSFDFHPDQTIATHRHSEDFNSWYFTYENRSDFTVSPMLSVSFRPKRNMEFYGAFNFRKEKLHGTVDFSPVESQLTNRILHLDFGLTVLGRDFLHVLTPFSSSEIHNFFVPYGFRAPMINRGQSALGLGYHYRRTKSEHQWSEPPYFSYETADKMYHFSLDGLYALTDWLTFKGGLELFPGQDRRNYPGYVYAYDGVVYTPPMITSKFSLCPHLDLSFRPKGEFEFYGTFDFRREEFNLNPRFLSSYMDERRESYYFDFGFSILGSLLRRTRPDLGSDLSDFFTPYGFRTPVLRQAQYAVNLNFHYSKTDAEGPNPPASGYYLNTTEKMYYFSLGGAYAPFNWMVFEASLDFCPGQASMTYRYTVQGGHAWYIQNDRSNFAVFPGVAVSFRPKANLEVFGSLNSANEKLHSEGGYPGSPDWKTEVSVKREALRFDFGLTILGSPW